MNRNRNLKESEELCKKVREIAKERGLLVSGGGDFHRMGDGWEIGEFGIGEKDFLKLKKVWKEKYGSS